MLQGLYSVATAIDAAMVNQDVVARNLAHINVPGFRRVGLTYETLENARQEPSSGPGRLGAHVPELHTDFTPGPIQKTGQPLDLAIHGDGFFVLEGPRGPLYSRNGVFHLDAEGRLVNSEGLAVQGVSGPLTLPTNAAPARIAIGRDGTVSVDGERVGQVKVVRFADNQRLVQAGTTSFRAPPDMAPEAVGDDVGIEQGARELSNVSGVEELVRLLAGLRYSEASQRALRTIGEILGERMRPQ